LVGGAGRDAQLVMGHIARRRNVAATTSPAQLRTGQPEARAQLSGVVHAADEKRRIAQG
jgi:hypothetical protein